MFSACASGLRFHLLIGAEELATCTLVQNVSISIIFKNETPTLKAEVHVHVPVHYLQLQQLNIYDVMNDITIIPYGTQL